LERSQVKCLFMRIPAEGRDGEVGEEMVNLSI